MSSTLATAPVDEEVGDRIEDMLRDLGQEGFRQAHSIYCSNFNFFTLRKKRVFNLHGLM